MNADHPKRLVPVLQARVAELEAALTEAMERCEFLGERFSANFQVPISLEHTEAIERWRALLNKATVRP